MAKINLCVVLGQEVHAIPAASSWSIDQAITAELTPPPSTPAVPLDRRSPKSGGHAEVQGYGCGFATKFATKLASRSLVPLVTLGQLILYATSIGIRIRHAKFADVRGAADEF